MSLLSCLCNVSVCLGGWGVASRADGVRKPPGPWKVSDLDIVVDPVPPSHPETQPGPVAPSGSDGTSRECTVRRKHKDGTCWTFSVAQNPQQLHFIPLYAQFLNLLIVMCCLHKLNEWNCFLYTLIIFAHTVWKYIVLVLALANESEMSAQFCCDTTEKCCAAPYRLKLKVLLIVRAHLCLVSERVHWLTCHRCSLTTVLTCLVFIVMLYFTRYFNVNLIFSPLLTLNMHKHYTSCPC